MSIRSAAEWARMPSRLLKWASGGGGGRYWFDGTFYGGDDVQQLSVFLGAVKLAACHDGTPCAPDDEMALACIAGGTCARDRETFMRNRLVAGGGSDEMVVRTFALAQRIRSAVESQNLTAFVR